MAEQSDGEKVIAYLEGEKKRKDQASKTTARIVLAVIFVCVVGIVVVLHLPPEATPSYTSVVNNPGQYNGSYVSWHCTITHAVPQLAAVACRVAPFLNVTNTGEVVAALAGDNANESFASGTPVIVSGTLGLSLMGPTDPADVSGDLWIEDASVTMS